MAEQALSFELARELCTAAELKVIESARREALAKATPDQLRKNIVLARSLRDKWRDQAQTQRRQVQAAKGARGVDGNERSKIKSRLFAAALARFEKQLAKVESQGTKAAGGSAGKVTKQKRASKNRKSRAQTRKGLAMERRVLSPATRPPQPETPTEAVEETPPASDAGVQPAAKPTKKRRRLAPPKVVGYADAMGQVKASAAAKRNRVKISGQNTRVHAHISSRGKKSQARRDSKGR